MDFNEICPNKRLDKRLNIMAQELRVWRTTKTDFQHKLNAKLAVLTWITTPALNQGSVGLPTAKARLRELFCGNTYWMLLAALVGKALT